MEISEPMDYQPPSDRDLEEHLGRLFVRRAVVREASGQRAYVPSTANDEKDEEKVPQQYVLRNESLGNEIIITTHSSPFHIQQNTTVKLVKNLLTNFENGHAVYLEDVSRCTELGEYTLRATVLPFVRQLGLIDRLPGTRETYQLTPWARQLHRMWLADPDLLAEAVHLHLATRYLTSPEMRASWAYATAAGLLWDRAPLIFEPRGRERLAAEIRVAGAAQYGLGLDRVAFSHNSVRGVMNWLGALVPPVIVSPGRAVRIARRTSCPVPAVWWATSELARIGEAANPGRAPIAGEEYRLNLARILFLEPASAEPMLRVASAEAPLHMGEPILAYDPSSMEVRVARRLPIGTLPLDVQGVAPQ